MGNRSSSKLARALVDNDLQSAEKIYYVNEKAIKPFEFITKNKNDTWYGTTLTHCAALGGNERFLRLFLEKEISQIRTNIEKCNLAKESILHCACGGGIENAESNSRISCVVYILKILQRKNINLQDQSGRTALHHAARRGRAKIVNRLLEAGADASILNYKSMTAADEAQQGGASNIASHLESKTIFSSLTDKSAKVLATTSNTNLKDVEGKGLILQDVRAEKDGALIEVSTMLGIDLWTAEALLRYFKWDKTKTANEFLSNPHRACKKAGVSSSKKNIFENSSFGLVQETCLICGDKNFNDRANVKNNTESMTLQGTSNNDNTPIDNDKNQKKQTIEKTIGVWYETEWIEEIDYLKSIQMSMSKPIAKMKIQRLINNLKSQQLMQKEVDEDVNKNDGLDAQKNNYNDVTKEISIATNPFVSSLTQQTIAKKVNTNNSLEMIELPACGHTFCKLCWSEYLKIKIKDGNMKIICPKEQCNHLVPIDIILRIVSYDIGQKYLYFDLKSFVESNENINWCPRPSCEFAVKKIDIHNTLSHGINNNYNVRQRKYGGQILGRDFFFNGVTCVCEHRFCFKCKTSPPHDPASCKMIEDWKALISKYIGMEKHKMSVAGEMTGSGANELASEIWLRANTKNCPKCKVLIQKNDGCNHMTCKHCTHQFCWICMGDWKAHGNNTGGFFRCDIYKGSGAKTNKEEKKQSDARAKDVEKFVSFYTQSVAHQNSLHLERPLLASAESRMIDILQSTNQSNTDVTFVNAGFFILIKSRSILKAAWIWAYFKAPYLASKEYDTLNQNTLKRNNKTKRGTTKTGHRRSEVTNAIHELSTATEILSDMLARRRFRHNRSEIVRSINASYAAVDRFYQLFF